MKRTLVSLLGIGLMLAMCMAASADAVLFSDSYTVSGNSWDINYEYNSGARQGGSLGPLQYTENPFSTPRVDPNINDGHLDQLSQVDADGAIGAMSLFSTGNWGNDFKYAWASPNYNFKNWTNLTIEFDVNPTVSGVVPPSGFGVGMSFGSDVQGAYFFPGSGSYGNPVSPSGGLGIALAEDGRIICFSDPDHTAVWGNVPLHSGFYHFKVTIDTAGYGGGQSAHCRYWVDGIAIHDFVRAGGLNNNYITLGSESINGNIMQTAFDNLVITTTVVPEPSALAGLFTGLAGVCGLVIRRRK